MENLRPGGLINDSEPQKLAAALREVWALRQAVVAFGFRDLKVRYVHTKLGWIWLMLPLVLLMAPIALLSIKTEFQIQSLHLTKLLTILGGHILSSGMVQQTASIWVNQKPFLNKINLPVLFLPASRLVVVIPEWSMYSLIALLGGILAEGADGIKYFYVIQIFMLFGLGLGLLICTLSHRYRDVLHALPLLLQFQLVVVVIQLAGLGPSGDVMCLLLAYPPFFLVDTVISDASLVNYCIATVIVFALFYLSLALYSKYAKNALERV
ncbi:hypothetical protein [Schleiferia thermophila]|uniref:ABC-2 type transport system permease protein n=1 Tax=Schleiferia thermophila TaxID=884107 RepID=A0A368ZZ68_9FLAO|nr:hypothetical protein [Schleiferia thermophila]RCX02245.1 hypothetical protein DES35_1044 [Schleiferia thermophila]